MHIKARLRAYRPEVQAVEERVLLSQSPLIGGPTEALRASAEHARVTSSATIAGLLPLTQFQPGELYQGYSGGLYGNGRNEPPPRLLDSAMTAAAAIVPRGRFGQPSAAGKIGVVGVGQSTSMQWFAYFQRVARQLPSRYVFVNGGQDEQVSQSWARSSQPWKVAAQRIRASGLSRYQVQVLILDSVRIRSWTDGSLAGQIAAYGADLSTIIRRAKFQYPNIKIVYLLPFHFSGYVPPRGILQEPFSYQLGFGIQRLVETQGRRSPVLLWGPYVWEHTVKPYYYYDGVHFSPTGRSAMAEMMWSFLQSDSAARVWMKR